MNSQRIEPKIDHPLAVNDRIVFGCPLSDDPAEFDFCFETFSTSKLRRGVDSLTSEGISSPAKRVRLAAVDWNIASSSSSSVIESNAMKIKEQEDKITRLSEELRIKDVSKLELEQKLEETERGLMEQLEQQRWDLQNERKNAERELKNMLEQQLCQKELLLRHEYDEQISLLTNERKRIEKSLQEELSSKLSEKDNAYQEELERQKIVLDQSMLERESEKNRLIAELKAKEGLLEQYRSVEENQRQLEDCLEELRKQITEKDDQLSQQKEVTKQVEMDAKQTIVSAMEDEFTCVICQELFISATILPCAHTFCQLCICGWMKKKKNCPVCRRKIKGKAVRSFAFDSAVEKMVETMDDDYKDRRATLRREREEQTRRDQAAGNVSSAFDHARPSSQPPNLSRSVTHEDVILIS